MAESVIISGQHDVFVLYDPGNNDTAVIVGTSFVYQEKPAAAGGNLFVNQASDGGLAGEGGLAGIGGGMVG